MKKLLVIFAILAFAVGGCATAEAGERDGKIMFNSGLGFNAGQGGSTAFYWNYGMDYYFTDMISINPNLLMSVDGGFIFGIVPRARFTFDVGVEHFELFGDAGAGVLVGDVTDFIFVFGGGAYYWILDDKLGLGTDLNFALTGVDGYVFRVLWGIASVAYRF